MVSIRPFISKSYNLCTIRLVYVPSAPITIAITKTFMSHVFSVLKQDLGTYSSFIFPFFLPCDQPEQKIPLFGRISFVVDYHQVYLCGREYSQENTLFSILVDLSNAVVWIVLIRPICNTTDLLWGLFRAESLLFGRFSFCGWLSLVLVFWLKLKIRFYEKIAENCMRIIFWDRILVLPIPFVYLMKF